MSTVKALAEVVDGINRSIYESCTDPMCVEAICARCDLLADFAERLRDIIAVESAGARLVTNEAGRGAVRIKSRDLTPEEPASHDREATCSGALPKIRQRSEIEDCGQDGGVCKLSPGCNRHWEERNRELLRENEVLRSNSDHLSSENASLARQVESMAMRIESLAEELAKPEDVRLREVLDALDGRAVIFDGLGARVTHLLDEMDEGLEKQRDVLERRCALQLGTIRELRETVEHLKQVTSEHAREVNRLTGANTELAEAFTEAERERDELKADLAHAIEVKNRTQGRREMSHPLVEILDDIQEEYELDLETTREESDITRLIDRREARKVAAFEARDLAVAKAAQEACEDVADSEREAIQVLDLNEIIKGVK